MIRQDEVAPVRSRRRMMYSYRTSEMSGKLRYPHGERWPTRDEPLLQHCYFRSFACREMGEKPIRCEE